MSSPHKTAYIIFAAPAGVHKLLGKDHMQTKQLTSAGHGRAEQRNTAAQHSTAQHSTARHSTARHSTARHSTAQHSTAQTLMTSASASSLSAGGKPGGCTMSKSACKYPLGRLRDLRRTSAISKRRKLSRPGPPEHSISNSDSDSNSDHVNIFANRSHVLSEPVRLTCRYRSPALQGCKAW